MVSCLILAGFFPALVQANDSAGTSSAGGIVFKKTPNVVMEQEKLSISPQNIQVSYLFHNKTKKNILALVFFPLPPYKMLGANVSWDSEINPHLAPNNGVPFVNFSVRVNHHEVAYQTITRAIYDKRDVTAQLKNAGIPLNPDLVAGNIPLMDASKISTWQLAAKKIGLLDAHSQPLWHKQIIYQWQQIFPAGKKIVIEHDYRPAAGIFYGDRIAALKQSDKSLFLADMQRVNDLFGLDLKQTVTATSFNHWLAAQIKTAHFPSARHCNAYQAGQSDCLYAFFTNVNYILTTGANWDGPIKNFELILHYPPTGAVTYNQFYQQSALTMAQPGLIHIHIINFLPKQDLHILFADKKIG